MGGPQRLTRARFSHALALSFGLWACVLALVGCRSTSVATQNLDAVLSSEDTFRYQGDTTTFWEEFIGGTVGQFTGGLLGQRAREESLKTIPDPTGFALDNLLDLRRSGEGRSAWRDGEHVRIFARYALYAPSKLARERALLELEAHAERLGIETPYKPTGPTANAPELIEELAGLVDASRRLIAERAAPTETAVLDFNAAVEVIERSEFDVQVGSRLLRAIGPFLRTNALPEAQREKLSELGLDVQKAMVAEALARGLGDRSDLARSAAFRANLAVFGEDFAVAALFSLLPPRFLREEVVRRFDQFVIPTVPATFQEVHFAVFEYLEEHGLPASAVGETIPALELRGVIIVALWQIAVNTIVFSDRSRHAAMRALGTVSGGELETLRWEEWDTWRREKSEEMTRKINALKGVAPTSS